MTWSKSLFCSWVSGTGLDVPTFSNCRSISPIESRCSKLAKKRSREAHGSLMVSRPSGIST
jgi:hypothetical protein